MPELTSVIARCSGVVSRASTIALDVAGGVGTTRPKSTPVVAVRLDRQHRRSFAVLTRPAPCRRGRVDPRKPVQHQDITLVAVQRAAPGRSRRRRCPAADAAPRSPPSRAGARSARHDPARRPPRCESAPTPCARPSRPALQRYGRRPREGGSAETTSMRVPFPSKEDQTGEGSVAHRCHLINVDWGASIQTGVTGPEPVALPLGHAPPLRQRPHEYRSGQEKSA